MADLDFDRRLVAFRPNPWRRGKKGKTAASERVVPMFPQLEAILRDYLMGRHLHLRLQFDTTLLLPSAHSGRRLIEIRKMMDHVARRAGLSEGRYYATAFRKTFATAALQTLDDGRYPSARYRGGWATPAGRCSNRCTGSWEPRGIGAMRLSTSSKHERERANPQRRWNPPPDRRNRIQRGLTILHPRHWAALAGVASETSPTKIT